MSRVMSLMVALDANRYSSWAWPVPPLPAIALISAGSTQASAVLVTEFATPTTVITCLPTVMVEPTWPGAFAFEMTTWLSLVGQWPCCRLRSSTGPPGEDRPTKFSGVLIVPLTPGIDTWALTLSAANGPGDGGDALDLGRGRDLARRTRRSVSTVTATSAPFCDANAWSNGLCASASMPSARVEAAVATSTTRPMMMACSLRPPRPPRAARKTALMNVPLYVHHGACPTATSARPRCG